MGETSPSGPSGQPSIGDVLNGIHALRQSGVPENADFRLTSTAAHNYLEKINTFRTALKDYRDQAAALTTYGNPGGFPSATQTVTQLQNAVTDANDGIVPNLDGYITYLDELKEAVKAAQNRFQATDHG
jgi:hypothetical protein